MADSAALETDFRTLATTTGATYVAARTALLAHDASTLLAFAARKQAAPEWPQALAADILAGWLTERERFDQCTAAVVGDLPDVTPLTGFFSPQRRINAILPLGRAVTPRLLEMLLKTREASGDEHQVMTILGALARLKDPRAVAPLMDAVERDGDELIRELSASALGEIGDRGAVPLLLRVLRGKDRPDLLRAAAATSLATLGERAAIPDLRALAADATRDARLRAAAAAALAALRDRDSATLLLDAVTGTADLTLQLRLLGIVGELGNAPIIRRLEALESSAADELVRDAAREARQEIQERTA